MHEIAAFLAAHPPFDALDAEDLARLAASAEIEFFPADAAILAQGADPLPHLWVIRVGEVELLDHARVLDLLGPGEMLGAGSMLAGLPTGLAARATQDTLCYRLPADVATPILAQPAALPGVARSLLGRAAAAPPRLAADPLDRPVGELVRTELVTCEPDEPIREAARRMTAAGVSAVVVEDGRGGRGILTDRDLRSRVVGGDVPFDAPVSAAMTASPHLVGEGQTGSEAMLEMLSRGVRHLPVVTATGRLIGMVTDQDLMAAETHTPFQVRRAIMRAASPAGVAAAARSLRPTIVALHDADVSPERIGAIIAVVADGLTQRLIDLDIAAHGPPPAPFEWLALGSLARREAVPSSDVDSAMVWDGDHDNEAIRGPMVALGQRVMDGLEACGLPGCTAGAVASKRLFNRSRDSWRDALTSWLDDPDQEQALILVSIVVDGRPVWSTGTPAGVQPAGRPKDRPGLLHLVARFALSHRPPTGFLRDLVVEHSGTHAGRLDIKHGGVIPITDLARWAGLAAGVGAASTRERLRAAGEAGTLDAGDARTLEEAFDLVFGMRLDHQVQQLREGVEPDDFLDPHALNPLARSYLKEAFRAVAGVQKRVASDLGLRAW